MKSTDRRLAVEYRAVDALVPYARNSRTHDDGQVAQIAGSIREFGFTNPVLIDEEGSIIAGHGRVMAARKLGMAEVPTITLAGLTEAQRRAYVIADNKLALNAGWDFDMLAVEIDELRDAEFDVNLLGFTAEELNELIETPNLSHAQGLTDEDAVPEPQEDPVTVIGDVWLLGKHRVMCGDSTKADDVRILIGANKVALCLTDPPYGLGDTNSTKNDYIEYDDTRDNLAATIAGFLPIAQGVAPVVVMTTGTKNAGLYPTPSWMMAWFTPAGTGIGPWGFCCWQPILCYGKDPKLAKGKGSHPDAIVHTENAEKFGHPCTKPINFWKWLMERTSEAGESAYDPFGGSGTTIIAAEQLDRTCYAMELSAQYVDVIVRRWQDYTGKQATLEGDGRTFDELSAERLKQAA